MTTEIRKPQKGYRKQKIKTYSVMLRQSILFLRPDLEEDELAKMPKGELTELWCYLMNSNNETGIKT